MFRKTSINDCGSVYDLICEMENTALPESKFNDIFREQTENEQAFFAHARLLRR